jgi:ABC-type transport system substrate-binding protein
MTILIKRDLAKNEFVPGLAESWEQPAENEYVFKLRKGVKFHDGSDFDAQMLSKPLSAAPKCRQTKSMMSTVEKVEKIDDHTVKITLKAPSPIFINTLTHFTLMVIPDGAGMKSPEARRHGPYKFIENLTDTM